MERKRLIIRGEDEMLELAARLADENPGVKVYALNGDLGAGKTRFAQGLALNMGIAEPLQSPTFTLVNEYAAPDGRIFMHADLYRLRDDSEVAALGFEEMIDRASVVAVEWPDRAGDLIPAGAMTLDIAPGEAETDRVVTVTLR